MGTSQLEMPAVASEAPTRRRDLAVLGLAAFAAVASYVLWVFMPVEPASTVITIHPAVLAMLFFCSELVVIHLWVRGEAHSKTLSEVPLTLGLVIVGQTQTLVAAAIGAALALVIVKRQTGLKLAFNLAQYLLQVTSALLVFALLADRGATNDVIIWIAAITAALVAEMISSAMVTLAVRLHTGEIDVAAILRADLTSYLGVIGTSSVGVLAAALLQMQAEALALLAIVVAASVTAYRGYGALLRRHHHLELLQDYSRDIAQAVARDEVVESSLRGASALLDAQRAYLILTVPDSPGHVMRSSLIRGEVHTGLEPIDLADPITCVIGTHEAMHIKRASHDVVRRQALDQIGVGEVLVAPLRADGEVIGVLAVANEPATFESFDRNDLALFITLCDQTALTLQNGTLFHALRAEVDEREYRALHDDVTGLGNRSQILISLQGRFAQGCNPLAVAVIGLNRFGAINHELGYERGDEVLSIVAARLKKRLRPNDILARIAGGEFAVVLDDISKLDAAEAAARSLVAIIQEPIAVGGIEITLGAHAGISLWPTDATDAGGLLRRADAALRVAKSSRRIVETYDKQRDMDAAGRLALAAELRHAIDRQELTVAYQPKAALSNGKVTGVEALVRWNHPTKGNISPDEFVLLAEQTGSIHALTEFVLQRSLQDRVLWTAAGLDLSLSVNISAHDLDHDWLRTAVPLLLEKNNCPPSSLTLEVTETQLMSDVALAAASITPLHDLGVRISIDDYGTGYSSLAVLRALPIDEIKIDKSFVLDMRADASDAVLVRSTVQLGQALGLSVVAEGVETNESWHLLADWGCDRAQGYLISRPVSADKIPATIRAWIPPEVEGRTRLGLVS